MKILFITTGEAGDTFETIARTCAEKHEVEIVRLDDEPDYETLVDRMTACDRVVSWTS